MTPQEIEDLQKLPLEQLAALMKKTKVDLDAAKEVSAKLQDTWDTLRKQIIPQVMEDMGVESVRITGIGTVSERTDAYCTVPADNRQAVQDWMKEHGHGELVTETINSSTLKAFMKEQILEGNEVPIDLINYTPYTYVAITGKG